MTLTPLNIQISSSLTSIYPSIVQNDITNANEKLSNLPHQVRSWIINDVNLLRSTVASANNLKILFSPPATLTEIDISIHRLAVKIFQSSTPETLNIILNSFKKLCEGVNEYRPYQILEPLHRVQLVYCLEIAHGYQIIDKWAKENNNTWNIKLASDALKHQISSPSCTHLNLKGLNLKSLPNIFEMVIVKEKTTSIDLSGNDLTVLPSSFSMLENATKIDLSHNSFSEIPSVVLKLNNIEEINISNTKIEELSISHCELKNLKIIIANNMTKLHLISPSVLKKQLSLKNCTHLYKIIYNLDQHNKFISPISDFQEITEKWELENIEPIINEWAENQEFGIEAKEVIIGFLNTPKMTQLNLDNFNLSSLPDIFNSIATRTRLQKLWLNNNPLTELPPSFIYLENLEELRIKKSQFSFFPLEILFIPSDCKLRFEDANISEKDLFDQINEYSTILEEPHSWKIYENLQRSYCNTEILRWSKTEYEGVTAAKILLYFINHQTETQIDLSYLQLQSLPECMNGIAFTKRCEFIAYPESLSNIYSGYDETTYGLGFDQEAYGYYTFSNPY